MEKIETFLYDILGLCIPGLVVILTMEFKLNLISKTVNLLKDIPHCCMTFLYLTVFVIVCYITGSILKVISKYFYKIMQRIFDESINKIINTWKIKNLLESFIGKDLYELVAEIFVYKPQNRLLFCGYFAMIRHIVY